jgi:hypothetical protein
LILTLNLICIICVKWCSKVVAKLQHLPFLL